MTGRQRVAAMKSLACAWLMAAAAATAAEAAEAPPVIRKIGQAPANPALLDELRAQLPSFTDPDVRSLALAVYALGRLHGSAPADAERAREALAREFPASPYLRHLTKDALVQPCEACQGKGTQGTDRCVLCKGSGRCVACQGRGSTTSMGGKKIPCAACAATGRCRECMSEGRKAGAAPCTACGGTGEAWDRKKIRRVIRGIVRLGPGRGDQPLPEDEGEAAAPGVEWKTEPRSSATPMRTR